MCHIFDYSGDGCGNKKFRVSSLNFFEAFFQNSKKANEYCAYFYLYVL